MLQGLFRRAFRRTHLEDDRARQASCAFFKEPANRRDRSRRLFQRDEALAFVRVVRGEAQERAQLVRRDLEHSPAGVLTAREQRSRQPGLHVQDDRTRVGFARVREDLEL